MKILLCGINAKYIHTNLAIRQIKGYAEKRTGLEIGLIEFTINNYLNEIVDGIYIEKADIVAISCYLWNIEIVKKLVVILKKLLPEIIVILGGPEVTYRPHEIMTEIPCDFVISSEGEVTFVSLLEEILRKNNNIKDVFGISYRDGKEIISNKAREPMNMADLPFPYDNFKEIENKICYYEASRGCPFACEYCLSSVERGVRFAPIEKVCKELKIFLDNMVTQVKFVDRTFNCNKLFAMEIISFIIKNDNFLTNFHFEVAAELLNDDIIGLLSKARKGLFQLEIGVQTTNDDTLSAISRRSNFTFLCDCVEKLKKPMNMHLHLDLIAGLPLENFESFKKSFNDVHSLLPHQLQLGFLKILKGSGMEGLCDKYEIDYSPFPPYEILKTNCLSYDEVLSLKSVEEIVEIFYNTNRFCNSITYLAKFYPSFFDLYNAISVYKSEKGVGSLVHNKQFSYAFLIDFANDKIEKCNIEVFSWIVKLDYLLHEKPRSLPEWSKKCDNLIDKDSVYNFIVKENRAKSLVIEYEDCDVKQVSKLVHIEKFPFNPFTFEEVNSTFLFNYRSRDLWGNAKAIPIELS